ncbi:restriction endonuclease subunit S [Streptococcus pneumoniae]|uniref:restriction endonuclease subunit S n=1 Tax=Streptococcus pneumoniae TaxID=1313 RepID=UPI0009955D76
MIATSTVATAFMARRALEQAVHWIYSHDSYLEAPYRATLSSLVWDDDFRDIVDSELHKQIVLLIRWGNHAAHGGEIKEREAKQFITKTKDKLLRKGKLERYDIVLTIRGTVGNVAYYDELIKYKHLRINSGMVILRPKTPNLNQKFIIHVLRNNNYSRVISGSAQPQLPITKLKKILLPLPPLALQNEFADFVVQVDKSQLAIQKSLEELETLKKSLMQEYFG